MRYLVCGFRGFIGSELCRQLLELDTTDKIYGIDDDSKGYGNANIKDLLPNPKFGPFSRDDLSKLPNDTLDFPNYANIDLRDIIEDVDYVINFAAKIGGIGYFNRIPRTIIRDNNLILTNLLDVIVESKRRPRFINLSSSMVFESATKFPSKESDLASTVIPITSYGMSKLCSEYYCKAYAAQDGLKYTIIRPFNAVGPERPDPNFVGFSHVIPDLICKIKNGQGTFEKPLEILGNGLQVRHYTAVSEIAKGIIMAMHSDKAINEDFNISIPVGHSVQQVAELVWAAMNQVGIFRIKFVDGFAHDVQFRSPDTTKAKEILGFEAKLTLEDTMPEIVESVLKLLAPSVKV